MKKKQTITTLLIILSAIIIFVAYKMINSYNKKEENNYGQNLNKTQATQSQNNTETQIEEKKETEKMLEVANLKNENQDVVGWLEIDGTDISYPVLQDSNNEYYMTHNYKKQYTKDGSLFLDKDYNWDLPSSNLLIYGHNNRNGKMFSKLLDYKNEDFYKEHPTIKFTTPEEEQQYEIIAVFYSHVYYKHEQDVFRYYFFINAENEQQFNDYVNNSKKASIYDTGKTAQYGDQLLTLSTCSYHTQDGRFAVVAKKE